MLSSVNCIVENYLGRHHRATITQESLAIFNTGISGTIPDLSNLQKLEVFKVEHSDLTGSGFTSLYDIPSLKRRWKSYWD